MGDSAIEWTDKTWNPVVGCTKVSPGCKNCYAKTLHDQRHKAHKAGKPMAKQYAKPFEKVQLMPERLREPLTWKAPRRVFVNSVSDLFHVDVPDDFLDRVFAVMALAGRHTFQVLTKRADRMAEYMKRLAKSVEPLQRAARDMGYTFKYRRDDGEELPLLPWPIPNVWLGVSVENQEAARDRIPLLMNTPAAVRFLSCEPLLGELKLDQWLNCYWTGTNWCRTVATRLVSLSWVIVGGESGPGARPCRVEWVRDIVAQCKADGTPVFVKQLGSGPEAGDGVDVRQTLALRSKKGGDMTEWPNDLQIREFPKVKS